MNAELNFKSLGTVFLQVVAGAIGSIIVQMITNAVIPMPASILEQTPAKGFLSLPGALMLNGLVNAAILVWVARRSAFKGLPRIGQLFLILFGAGTFMTQIETAYFISAFALLQGNFEVYRLILRGLFASGAFASVVAVITGGFSKALRPESRFTVESDRGVCQAAWLAGAYVILYLLFGYFVAWQSQEVRLFYGGPAEANSFFDQLRSTLLVRPEFPVFQYFRGVLWILCLIPLFKGFTGRRVELVALSGLALGLLPTVALAFPNPLMPAGVSMYHFWETSISTGIFGALCAWFVPGLARSEGSIEIPVRAAA